MGFEVDQDQLEAIWRALSQPPRVPRPQSARRRAEQIVVEGWAFFPDVEDLLADMDDRLWGVRSWLVELFGIPRRTVFRRPRRKTDAAMGSQAIAAADLTRLLILLERLGFETEPSVLVGPLMQSVTVKPMLSEAELDVLWYADSRHKIEPLSLTVKDKRGISVSEQADLTTSTGYRVTTYLDGGGRPWMLSVRAPHYRRRPDPVETKCEICGDTWWRGDRSSSARHRAEHRRRLEYLEPKPHGRFLRALAEEADPEVVTSRSPAWRHREIYRRAAQFRRDFGYDFVQWQSPKGDKDPHVHGFLFNDDTGVFGHGAIAGACSFRQRGGWVLDWAWVAPRARRQGILTRRLAPFRERFGEFGLEYPLSEDMRSFAQKLMPWAQVS